MLWSLDKSYQLEPFELEEELETSILEAQEVLFGNSRIYLDMKKLIGQKGNTRNIPDGYLIDLASIKEPKLYLVENELAKHDPLKHIAIQILEFSLSFETSPQVVKSILKEGLNKNTSAWQKCNDYAIQNGFENIDYLLERMIYKKDSFNALVIIDDIDDELETVLLSRFKFPVEVLTFERFVSEDNKRLYRFEPFLSEVGTTINVSSDGKKITLKTIDPSEINTVVVPAQEEGFLETFIKQNCWYAIRIHSSMLPKIKYIAAYRVAPESAITHIAEVKSIEQWQDSNKYILNFTEPAKKIGPIKLVPKSIVKAPQSSRYTSYEKLLNAKTLDDVF
jgi:hypothetical protein